MVQQARLPEPERPKRRPAIIAAVSAVALVVLAGVGWKVFRTEAPPPPSPPPRPRPVVEAQPPPPPPEPYVPPLQVDPTRGPQPPLPKAIPGAKTDAALLERLREAVDRDPGSAIVFAAKHAQAFPRSKNASERDLLHIKALMNMGRLGDARVVAKKALARDKSGPVADEITKLTGPGAEERYGARGKTQK